MSKPARGHVYVVDDNPDIRFYLTDLLRQMGYSVEEYAGASAFLQQSMDISPAVLVSDVRMPGMSGIELQEQMHVMGRRTPIIFMSGESQSVEIIRAMKGAPIEFLWKPFQIQALIDAIDRGLVIDLQKRDKFIRHNDVRRKFAELSTREREVFALMLEGFSNKGISDRLDILPDTVKKHRANVLQKMQTIQLADLMAMFKGIDISSLRA
jgi:FixJ family two-component response regulator